PTREYFDAYNRINEQLDALVTLGAEVLQQKGFTAVAQTRAQVEQENLGVLAEAKTQECRHTLSHNSWAALPHKTVATRAGLGWIGKCALLVTETYGSAVRLSSILTNAPLTCAQPVNASRCGVCAACVTACPAAAVTGAGWSAGTLREALVDVAACRKTARQRALTGFGVETSLCGKCIEVCPYTRRGGTGKKNEGNLTPRLPLSKQ
ncbi:MAG: hypothetical protein FWF49_05940, partial [Oscillospiraceae bacterium]|nr:hypothetical protein [Oscillospiraceae bacterium]